MQTNRVEIISDNLEQSIFTGSYKDGERLDEIKLAEHFGVSRTPIREALQRLVMTGLAEQRPRRGVFVRQPGPLELMEMFEAMAELEASCGRLAAMRMDTEAIDRLKIIDSNCGRAIDANDVNQYYKENELFHQEIYRGSANAYLRNEALKLQNRLRPYRRAQLRFRGRLAQSMSEHGKILEALENGDGDLAAAELRGHVSVQGERFHQLAKSLDDVAGRNK